MGSAALGVAAVLSGCTDVAIVSEPNELSWMFKIMFTVLTSLVVVGNIDTHFTQLHCQSLRKSTDLNLSTLQAPGIKRHTEARNFMVQNAG